MFNDMTFAYFLLFLISNLEAFVIRKKKIEANE